MPIGSPAAPLRPGPNTRSERIRRARWKIDACAGCCDRHILEVESIHLSRCNGVEAMAKPARSSNQRRDSIECANRLRIVTRHWRPDQRVRRRAIWHGELVTALHAYRYTTTSGLRLQRS